MFHYPLQRLTQENKRFLRVSNDHSMSLTNRRQFLQYALVLELSIDEVNSKQDWPLPDFFQLLKQRNSCNDVGMPSLVSSFLSAFRGQR